MRKLTFTLGALALVLAGCGGESRPPAKPTKPTSGEPAPEEPAGKPRWDVSKPPELPRYVAIREPAAAGSFYPGAADRLRADVEARLKRAGKPPELAGKLRALIVPHAGYVYSGDTAAAAYAALKGRGFDQVVLLGPPHGHPLRGVSVSGAGCYRNPLGLVRVNEGFAAKLERDSGARYVQAAHAGEHSLEVQLPFLQVAIGPGVRIVPVLVGADPAAQEKLAKALAGMLDERTLVVVSTDLSHYPTLNVAGKVDAATAKSWETLDVKEVSAVERRQLAAGHARLACTMCGSNAVKVLMRLAPLVGIKQVKLLKLDTSATAGGDRNRVVGYAAAAFLSTGGAQSEDASARPPQIPKEGQKKLLKLAREAATASLKGQRLPGAGAFGLAAELKQPGGAFVTLKNKGRLRGCIGRYPGKGLVYEVVRQMAVAATRDGRFLLRDPVTAAEMKDIDVEISVLSPLRRIKDWRKIKLGTHGVVLRRGWDSGVFLPQVATETGWSLEEFLGHLAKDKAGLWPEAYKDPKTEILVFTCLVFGEKEKSEKH